MSIGPSVGRSVGPSITRYLFGLLRATYASYTALLNMILGYFIEFRAFDFYLRFSIDILNGPIAKIAKLGGLRVFRHLGHRGHLGDMGELRRYRLDRHDHPGDRGD